MVVAKHVMRYLKGTVYYGLNYTKDHDFILNSYTTTRLKIVLIEVILTTGENI